jgi:uncharacterized coiled-coil protein SlyX
VSQMKTLAMELEERIERLEIELFAVQRVMSELHSVDLASEKLSLAIAEQTSLCEYEARHPVVPKDDRAQEMKVEERIERLESMVIALVEIIEALDPVFTIQPLYGRGVTFTVATHPAWAKAKEIQGAIRSADTV